MRSNGVRQTKCAPYQSASNGQVERVVQILKTVLHKHTQVWRVGNPATAEFSADISHNSACCHRSYSCRTIPEKTATYSAHIIEAELDDRRSEDTSELS